MSSTGIISLRSLASSSLAQLSEIEEINNISTSRIFRTIQRENYDAKELKLDIENALKAEQLMALKIKNLQTLGVSLATSDESKEEAKLVDAEVLKPNIDLDTVDVFDE